VKVPDPLSTAPTTTDVTLDVCGLVWSFGFVVVVLG
jgi:hypothetical protein